MKTIRRIRIFFLIGMVLSVVIPSAMAAAAKNHPDIRTEKKQEEIKSNQGQVVLKTEYAYPQIINPKEEQSIAAVNDQIKTYAMERYKENYQEGQQLTEEFLRQLNESQNKERSSLLPFIMSLQYETAMDAPWIVSFLWEESNYFGGAHPDTKWKGDVYNLKTGQRLEAKDILSIDEKEIKRYIAQAFAQKSKEEPGNFFPEEVEKLSLLQFEYYFYLNEEGMVFFLEPYRIAPYAAGRVEVILPYEKNQYFRSDILDMIGEGRN